MTAVAEQILANVFAALQALTVGAAPVAIFRDRGYNVGIDTLPAISLDDGGDISTDDTRCFGVTFKTREIRVELRAAATDDDAVATAISALYVRVAAIVLADYSQGGVAIDTHDAGTTALIKVSDAGQEPIGAATATFHVDYQHVGGRPDLLS